MGIKPVKLSPIGNDTAEEFEKHRYLLKLKWRRERGLTGAVRFTTDNRGHYSGFANMSKKLRDLDRSVGQDSECNAEKYLEYIKSFSG